MKAASVHELKKTLVKRDPGELLDACLRLARFKKENKELLTYLLFHSRNEEGYVTSVCDEIDEMFESLNRTSRYLAKKGIRKIVRRMELCLRYTGIPETDLVVRIHFCRQLIDSGIPFKEMKVTANMYQSQLHKIDKVFLKLHEEIQDEYRSEVSDLV